MNMYNEDIETEDEIYYKTLVEEKFVGVSDFGKVGKGNTNFGVNYIEVFVYESVETSHKFYEVEHNSCTEIPYKQSKLVNNKEIDVNNMLDNFDNERLESDTVEKTEYFSTKEGMEEYLEKQDLYGTLSDCIKDTEWVQELANELIEEDSE